MALQSAAFFRFAVPLLVLSVASACGGGGTNPPPPPPPQDTTAPMTQAQPAGGTFTAPVSVTLSCDDGDGSGCSGTFYTTDGSTPSQGSTRYSAPIAISAVTTLKFFSVDVAGNGERMKTEQYTFTSITVSATPRGGTYGSPQTVMLECTAGAGVTCGAIHYTTDGSNPTTSSPTYSGPLSVGSTTTLKFFALDNLGRASAAVIETYVININSDNTAPTTTANPPGGTYDTAQNVTLTCNDGAGSGCRATYYTTNGSQPTRSSNVYSAPIRVDRPLMLRFASEDMESNLEFARSETYTFTSDVSPPTTTANPPAGVYQAAQNVTLTCNDGAGGSGCGPTYYTTNGSTPTTSSPQYTTPISLTSQTTLRFFSVDQRGNTEAVQSATYFIGQAASDTSAQIAAVRAAPDGAMNRAIDLALVTYAKPPVGDPAGFFLQAEPSGPAIFIAVAPNTLNPIPVPGDRVSLAATQKATVNGMVHVTAVSSFLRNGTGESVEPMRANVTSVDLPAAVSNYESELIAITGTLPGTFAPLGTRYVGTTLSTTGSANNSNLQLRLPASNQDQLDLTRNCNVTVKAPLWRSDAQAQVSAWTHQDITIQSCPAPTVLSAVSSGRQSVVIRLDRRIDPASVQSNGSQFTFTNGMVATSATVQDREIRLFTSTQNSTLTYTVTLATTLRDTLGTAIDSSARSATFTGFQSPAVLRITEVAPNLDLQRDLLELYVVQGGSISDATILQDTSTLANLPAVNVATGDIIVVHFNPDIGVIDAPASETASKTQYPSATYSSNYDNAWDIHASTQLPITWFNRVLRVKDALGNMQDGVPFVRTDRTSDPNFPTELGRLQSEGHWQPTTCGGGACSYTTNPSAQSISVNWETVSTDRTTTVRRVSPTTDTNQASDWSVGASSLGSP